MIWVQYEFAGADLHTNFWAEKFKGNSFLLKCPGCGKHLDIDELG